MAREPSDVIAGPIPPNPSAASAQPVVSASSAYAAHIEVLGSGHYGVVSKVQRYTDGRLLVCKTIQYNKIYRGTTPDQALRRAREKRHIKDECGILMKLEHENIVQYVHQLWDEDAEPRPKCYLYMELCELGDLEFYIENKLRSCRRFPTEYSVWRLLSQLSAALTFCHEGITIDSSGTLSPKKKNWQPILHRDIKSANVLISGCSEGGVLLVKLGDFGLGAILTDSRPLTTYAGTSIYLAPEIQESSPKWSTKSDIFALGCVLYEYTTTLKDGFKKHIMIAEDLPAPPDKTLCSNDLRELMMGCLEIDPEDRPQAQNVLLVAHSVRKAETIDLDDDAVEVLFTKFATLLVSEDIYGIRNQNMQELQQLTDFLGELSTQDREKFSTIVKQHSKAEFQRFFDQVDREQREKLATFAKCSTTPVEVLLYTPEAVAGLKPGNTRRRIKSSNV